MVVMCAAGLPGLSEEPAAPRLRRLLGEARAAETAEDLPAAAKAYRDILRLRPGWGAAELNLALVLAAQRDYAGALANFESALRHDASLLSAELGRGVALYNLERYAEAAAPLARYAAAKPEDTEVHYYLGRTFAALGEHARAIPAFRAQLRLTPAHAEAFFALGDSARLLCGEVARQLAGDAEAAYFFTLIAAEEPGSGEESRILDAIAQQPARPEAYVTLGLLRLARGQRTEAAASFQEAWKRGSEDCRISTTCSEERDLSFDFQSTRRPEDAYAAAVRAKRLADWGFRKLVETAPTSPLAAQARAHLFEQAGDAEQAGRHYRDAVEHSRRDSASLTAYAKFHARQSRLGEAASLLREAMLKEPGSPVMAALLGEVLFVSGEPAAALPFLQRASRARPADEQTRSYLAQSLAKAGRTVEAIQVLETAPADPGGRLHFLLGTLHRRAGNAARADRAFAIYKERRNAR
ncbi:MAG: tetratricopeptide repeat protein [Acidobacteria bacterium]|nr:tetratricopeptide repeat protein [Acidobacteriota bacterium]